MKRLLALALSHAFVAAAGFAAGIYVLPIWTAPPAPSRDEVAQHLQQASFRAEFRRELTDSDALHWGEGPVAVGPRVVAHEGRLAPGPAYKLYLVPGFVDTEAGFLAAKARSLQLGDVKTFDGFVVPLPEGVDLTRYDTVLVWCEVFSQFITSARYR